MTDTQPSPLQAAAVCLSSHGPAWSNLTTRAHLDGWVVARQHGLTVQACDAIINAALAGVRRRLTEWAEEITDPCQVTHPEYGRCVLRARHVDDDSWHHDASGEHAWEETTSAAD